MSITAGYMVPHPPLIIPEVGKGEEIRIAATVAAYRQVGREVAAAAPDTIVITTPHSIMYADYFHISPGSSARGDFGQFRAPQVRIETEYDEEFVTELSGRAQAEGIMAGTLGEQDPALDHAAMIPLYFINRGYGEISEGPAGEEQGSGCGSGTGEAQSGTAKKQPAYKTVRIGLSGFSALDHYRLGMCIRDTAESLGRKTVFIASGDMSHKLKKAGPYGFAEEGPEYDEKVIEAMSRGDFLSLMEMDEEFCEAAAECGQKSFIIMAGAFDRMALEARKRSYEGPFGVGYGICSFRPLKSDENRNFGDKYQDMQMKKMERIKEKEDEYVRLARASIESYIRCKKKLRVPDGLPAEMTDRRAGAFVSLKKDGQLRGCIGTTAATRSSLAREIIENAVSAAVHDPRFSPVRADELGDLVYSVDVLGEAEPVDTPEELDVKKYGVIVSSGGRRGLLLPDLAGVDTVEEQISISKQKAGIGEDEPVQLERFEVVRHK